MASFSQEQNYTVATPALVVEGLIRKAEETIIQRRVSIRFLTNAFSKGDEGLAEQIKEHKIQLKNAENACDFYKQILAEIKGGDISMFTQEVK